MVFILDPCRSLALNQVLGNQVGSHLSHPRSSVSCSSVRPIYPTTSGANVDISAWNSKGAPDVVQDAPLNPQLLDCARSIVRGRPLSSARNSRQKVGGLIAGHSPWSTVEVRAVSYL